ncbi:MAG: YdbH domain-containing protein, partial [Alphaproteobacteria bacterium]|nr:YdbH domain-containing protein [Alphaproteobacteria bacterium]
VPLRSDGVRSIRMDSIGLGVPIEKPRIDFAVDGLDQVLLTEISGGFASGVFSARNIKVSLDRPTHAEIEVMDLDASYLSGLAKVEGLHAEGTLSGSMPVVWTPGIGLSILDASLAAVGPGTVRYSAGERDAGFRESGEQVGLMLDALSDFRFTTLGMNVNGEPGAGYRIGLALEGSNPNLYDGYPVRFNLDLSGQLDDIIKTGYRTYTRPTRVRDAVLQGGANE